MADNAMTSTSFVAPFNVGCRGEHRPALSSVRRRHKRVAAQKWRMIGPMLPDFGGGSKFFQSEIVQQEMTSFMEAQKMLGELGQKYKTFDRDGKIKYIDEALALVDRWEILLQRFKLSDEFQCQMYVRQLETYLSSAGMTTDMMLRNARDSLNGMRRDAERDN